MNMKQRNKVNVFDTHKLFHTVAHLDHVQLNFGISNTDILNTYVEVICKPQHLNFKYMCILPLISRLLGYLEFFNQSHLVRDTNEV